MWQAVKVVGLICTVVGAALTAISGPFCEKAAISTAVAAFMAAK